MVKRLSLKENNIIKDNNISDSIKSISSKNLPNLNFKRRDNTKKNTIQATASVILNEHLMK